VRQRIGNETRALGKTIQRIVDNLRQSLDYTSARLVHPLHKLQLARQSHQSLFGELGYLVSSYLDKRQLQIQQQVAEIRYLSPKAAVEQNLRNLAAVRKQLINARVARFSTTRQIVEHLDNKLKLMSPAHTLNRGYAILQDQNRDVVFDAGKTRKGQLLTASVSRGKFQCVVDRIVD
jgi:exodeoxyribonuclease VII large subunit